MTLLLLERVEPRLLLGFGRSFRFGRSTAASSTTIAAAAATSATSTTAATTLLRHICERLEHPNARLRALHEHRSALSGEEPAYCVSHAVGCELA